jgi:hypothetical protein
MGWPKPRSMPRDRAATRSAKRTSAIESTPVCREVLS